VTKVYDPFVELGRILDEAGLKLAVGLEAQGHIPTVEAMLAQGRSWEAIGKAIGWHGPTAKAWHERHRLAQVTRWAFIRELVAFRGFGPTTCPVCNLEWTTVDPGGECPAHKIRRSIQG
jgi:hypothetical protein